MLNHQGFDQWAKAYDTDVCQSNLEKTYPFAGYDEILETIEKRVNVKKACHVLDIGFGTGQLTQRLAKQGAKIVGVDFSEKMIEIAKEKMPDAQLFCADFAKGLPEQVRNLNFDFIISTYAIHHLDSIQKQRLLEQLTKMLKKDGEIILGDVLFESEVKMKACHQQFAQEWDEDEIYLIQQEMVDWLSDFQQTWYYASNCSGLVIFKRK